jgi:hypothetical protein
VLPWLYNSRPGCRFNSVPRAGPSMERIVVGSGSALAELHQL